MCRALYRMNRVFMGVYRGPGKAYSSPYSSKGTATKHLWIPKDSYKYPMEPL